MYYPDLSPYSYLKDDQYIPEEMPCPLNVGWLDIKHPFEVGEPSEKLLDALFAKRAYPVNKMRGYHQCQFCKSKAFGLETARKGKTLVLGSAEIRVKGKGGTVYAAPDLIYHYVAEHHYKPPQEFIDALLS